MTFDKQLEQLQISIDNFKISVEKYLTKKEIATLKELKWLLLEYKNQLIDFEMRGENNDIYKTNKIRK